MGINKNSKIWYTKSKRTAEKGDFIDILIVDSIAKAYKVILRVPLTEKSVYEQNKFGVPIIDATRFTFDFTISVMKKHGYNEIE